MPPSVTFVVTETLGTHPFGGIATATTHGALVLASHGFRVEILYCGRDDELEPHWRTRYEDCGVSIRWLDRSVNAGPEFVADSYRLYCQLRRDPPDAVVFQDWQGLGFCSVLAKRAGEFRDTLLVHTCHGPTDWLREANRQLEYDAVDAARAWMEQRSAECADAIVSPSQHLLDWMIGAGWTLPKQLAVIPYFTEGHVAGLDRPLADPRPQDALDELVFFGRLEERKGVRVFVDALGRLPRSVQQGLTVTFLGRHAPFTPEDVISWLDPEVRAALRDIRFEGSLDQAAARGYLARPGRVAVIPSLLDNSPNVIYECIEDRVPFLASDAGGNGELIHPDDRGAVLFAPDAGSLAATLERVLAAGVVPPPARPAFDGPTSLARWRDVLTSDEPAPPPLVRAAEPPAVTIVITHHNQARYVGDAVASAVAQDHPAVDVLVVDDGSTDPASLAALDDIEGRDWGRPVRVLRQQNAYLGAARNHGTREATTEFVAFLDDDDVLLPDYVSTLLGAIDHSDAAAATCSLLNRVVDASGEFDPDADEPTWVFLDACPTVGVVWNTYGGAALLARRDALLEVGGFHEQRGVGHEDWDLLARLVLDGRSVVTVPRPLYHYRIRPGSMIRSTSQYRNVGHVNASYAAYLPHALGNWPSLVRGQHEIIQQLREEVGDLRGELGYLATELDRRTRFFEFFGEHVEPRRAVEPGE